jgi:hypothetical protein
VHVGLLVHAGTGPCGDPARYLGRVPAQERRPRRPKQNEISGGGSAAGEVAGRVEAPPAKGEVVVGCCGSSDGA